MSCMSRCAVALGAALVAGASLAAHAADAPNDCHALADAAQRLACYDRVTHRPDAAAPPAAAPSAVPAASETAGAQREMREATATEPPPTTSMIDRSWGFDPASARYQMGFYNENYLMAARYTDRVNTAPFQPIFEETGRTEDLNNTEAAFQLSFKARVFTTDDRRFGVWAAYTQQSQWQIYNGDISRPFRETNYMPELFVSYRPGIDLPGGFKWNLVNAGYNHQSNGRSDAVPYSRSWDRLFAEFGIERENLALFAKVWWRIPESDSDDDNPDITDYYGHGEIRGIWRWRDNSFTAGVRGNLSTGKGAFTASWLSPPLLGPFRGYVKFFTGYGETLIDYNWRQTTFGAGIAISDGL